MRSQALGLAESTGLDFREMQIRLRAPWSWLPGHLCPWPLAGLSPGHDRLVPPWPRLLISCGRRSTATSIAIRRRSAGKTKTVHIQNPKIPPAAFDLVIAMRHDGMTGPNVFPVDTALHRVSGEILSQNRENWRGRLKPGGEPLIGVILGGANRQYCFTDETVGNLVRLIEHGLSLKMRIAVTPSRRTETFVAAALSHRFAGDSRFYMWDGTGDNPYFGLLALSDHLVVTCDSVSMISEALATGNPVHILRLEGSGRRHEIFLNDLDRRGQIAFPQNGEIDLGRTGAAPVNSTPVAAAEVMRLLMSMTAG